MKQIILILTLMMLMQACEFNVSTAKLTDVKVCTTLEEDFCNADEAQLDGNAETLFTTAKINNAPEGTIVSISWMFDNDGSWFEIDKVELKIENMNQIKSSLSIPTNGWPKGNYQVVYNINTDNSTPVIKSFSIN